MAGSVSGILLLVGPEGYRPPTSSASVAEAMPSASAPAVGAAPEARALASIAFDQATGKMVLFGGLKSALGAYNGLADSDTWVWDGAHWTQVPLDSGPAPRWAAGITYDAAHKLVVMRGGVSDQQRFIDDTWNWDGKRWLQLSPSQSPPVFVGGNEPLVWDGTRNSVVLFAYTRYEYPTYDIPDLNQTWTWDGSKWSQLATSNAPAGHGNVPAAMAFDKAHNSTVFFGYVAGTPTTWTLTGSAWTKVATNGPTSGSFVMAPDDARSGLVLFGKFGDTWTWDGTRWAARHPVHAPPARVGESMAYDSARRVVVLFGGMTPDQGSPHMFGDTWTWNGTDWTQVA